MLLSDLQSGMGIEYRGLSYIHGHLTPKNKTKKGVIKQVTPNLIAIEGDSYRDTILVNDLLSGQVQIIITEGDGELSAKKEVPTKEKLISLYVKHEGRIDPIRRELRVGSWALVKRWLVEAGIIDSLGRPLEQTPTPEPDQAANQEPERAEAEPAENIITEKGCPFDEEAYNPNPPEDNDFTAEDDEPIPYTVTEEKFFNLDSFKMRVLEIFQEVAAQNEAPANISLAFIDAIINTYPEVG